MTWKYFKKSEFDCKCCKQNKMVDSFVTKLDKLRGRMGFAFSVTSGYRCANHNKRVDGAINSQHLKGLAADISTKGWNGNQIYLFVLRAMALEFKGIGIGKDIIHLDDRSTAPAMWDYY
jgi:uncharacterized protein YcbK (DUF882 family)